MTTPMELTALTDPDNVMWVVEVPPDPDAWVDVEEATVASAKLTAYADLVARIHGHALTDDGAESAAGPNEPAGHRVTYKTVYAKHPNGAILETTDGRYRLVYNQIGNNWVVQENAEASGWEAVEVLSKTAAYRRAQELGESWTGPFVGERLSMGVGGKAITYRDVYGKYDDGAVIESLDGRHRMVFDSYANKWMFQTRGEDDAWADLGVFAKSAAYKKARELSGSWRPPVGVRKRPVRAAAGPVVSSPAGDTPDAVSASVAIPVRQENPHAASAAAAPQPVPVQAAAEVAPDEAPEPETTPLRTLQSRMPADLKNYWLRGEGALKVRWGTEGSFRRCVAELTEHFPQGVNGLCANLYHEATGHWPGEDRGK